MFAANEVLLNSKDPMLWIVMDTNQALARTYHWHQDSTSPPPPRGGYASQLVVIVAATSVVLFPGRAGRWIWVGEGWSGTGGDLCCQILTPMPSAGKIQH